VIGSLEDNVAGEHEGEGHEATQGGAVGGLSVAVAAAAAVELGLIKGLERLRRPDSRGRGTRLAEHFQNQGSS